jgi:hypothetical protein
VHTGSIPVSTSNSSTRARLAQRESASLTRKRSLVQSQYRAPQFWLLDGCFRFLILGLHHICTTSLVSVLSATVGVPDQERPNLVIMTNLLARVAIAAAAILSAPIAVADPEPTPPTPYQVPSQNGPILPGNEQLPPICAHAMQSCGFSLDPGSMTWQSRG